MASDIRRFQSSEHLARHLFDRIVEPGMTHRQRILAAVLAALGTRELLAREVADGK